MKVAKATICALVIVVLSTPLPSKEAKTVPLEAPDLINVPASGIFIADPAPTPAVFEAQDD